MIQSIYVKNFVLIDELQLDFKAGYSCFTGETGAGKSLLIDAISMLCGARASTSYIQKGKDMAFIEAVFDIDLSHPVFILLKNAGFEFDDDTLIVSRSFNTQGKNNCRINHRSVNVSLLKDALSLLIDIHSQHDTQYLLNSKYHLSLLDEYCNDFELLKTVKNAYEKYHHEKDILDHFLNEEASDTEKDYLLYQLEEINQIAIKENELEELEKKQKEMASFEKIAISLEESIKNIENSGYEKLYDTAKNLEHLDNEELNKIKENIVESYYSIEEQLSALKAYQTSLSFDEQEYDEIQSRLFVIQKLLRKHGNSYANYLISKQTIEKRLQAIENRDAFIFEQQNKIDISYQKFMNLAEKLHLLRMDAAKHLEKQIQEELVQLHLPNAHFEIRFLDALNENGIDKIEFYVSMNAGEEVKPLNKVASGGELSRLMLGLKTIFTHLQKISTIIFDEIDNGVSGNVAFAIGKKMREISLDTQVFSVTHLAPVAAWANSHYLVSKKIVDEVTSTTIHALNENERIKELATISNGSLNDAALEAAKQLLSQCK